jgi:hypothetical protein
VIFTVLTDGKKLPLYVTLKRENLPQAKFPQNNFKCEENKQMTRENKKQWLTLVWNKRPGVLMKKRGTLISDAFQAHLTGKIQEANPSGSVDKDRVSQNQY